MAREVFISHSSKDKSIADAVCASIEAAGIRCWIAPRDIRSGELWAEAIVEAIQSSRIMVLIFSSNSNNSGDVAKELTVAVNSGVIVVPFKIDDIMPDGVMRYYLSDTHWLDAMNPPTEEQIQKLVDTVRSIIESPESSRFAADRDTRERKTFREPGKNPVLWLAVFGIVMAAVVFIISRDKAQPPPAPVVREPEEAVTQREALPEEMAVEGEDWKSPSTWMEFVWIPEMDMWVGKYEVTNGEYREKVPGHDSEEGLAINQNTSRHPAAMVSFEDGREYAVWMTQQDRDLLPEGYRYRLPSEDEWMTFAQCGDGREYPWGENWPPESGQAGNYSNLIEGYINRPHISGSFQVEESWENPWGLYGVGGNLWEACAKDSSDGYLFGAWRGGSWNSHSREELKCSFRLAGNRGFDGKGRCAEKGFRLVLSR